jgi:hypothetical protein
MIPSNIATTLSRADELLAELLAEYEACLQKQNVSGRAMQLTHEVCESLRSVLDRTARRYWEIHISPVISEHDRKVADIYFPIARDIASMDSILGRWRWKDVRVRHQAVYDFLLAQQPFSANKNHWLAVVNDLAIQGKHIDLVPQKRIEECRTTVTNTEGKSVSWSDRGILSIAKGASISFGKGGAISLGSRGVRFSGHVKVAGAPIDTGTQSIVPTPGVTQRNEIWVSFLIKGYDANAAALCKKACSGTRRIATEMSDKFRLS